MNFDLDACLRQSRPLDTSDIRWEDVPAHPLAPGAVRTLRYMQDIEAHTIIYLKALLATRAVDDPDVAAFLPVWAYEEAFHGRALDRFLDAAGHPKRPRPRSRRTLAEAVRQALARGMSRLTDDFIAVHMTWGAVNELTTLRGYERLLRLARHPVLDTLLRRIMRDESRHFAFYYAQAERRLAKPSAARLTRFLLERAWAPVGTGVQPDAEVAFLTGYLFGGEEGLAAARSVDERISRLPGMEGLGLLTAAVRR